MFAESAIWTWWIAVALSIGAVFTVIALIVGYFTTVVRPKYPPKGRS